MKCIYYRISYRTDNAVKFMGIVYEYHDFNWLSSEQIHLKLCRIKAEQKVELKVMILLKLESSYYADYS